MLVWYTKEYTEFLRIWTDGHGGYTAIREKPDLWLKIRKNREISGKRMKNEKILEKKKRQIFAILHII